MTRDHLFTIANLKTLQGDVRKDAMTRVLEKAHQLELEGGEGSDATLEYTGMPLYSALVRYERTLSETSTFPSGKSKQSVSANPKSQPTHSSALEQAAAASEGKKRAEGRYTKEVLRSEDLWTSDGSFRYMALLAPCPECRKRTGAHGIPMCYGGRCYSCGYFGHRAPDCKHAPRPDFKSGGGGKQT